MIFDKDDPDFGDMQNVKRRMFALRNGVVAEALRRGGCPYRIVFGLTLPQLDEVASVTPHTVTLAQMLWDNDSTRESRLLAPMICPREGMTVDRAANVAAPRMWTSCATACCDICRGLRCWWTSCPGARMPI